MGPIEGDEEGEDEVLQVAKTRKITKEQFFKVGGREIAAAGLENRSGWYRNIQSELSSASYERTS